MTDKSATISVFIADDEPLARRLARRLLSGADDVEIAGECGNGDDLAVALGERRVDILLLDVRMPGRDVFDVLDERARSESRQMPAVIFTTAFERYAVRAFELNAADYLVKPLTPARFAEAMTRARRRAADARTSAETVARVARDLGSRPTRLLVPERGRMVPVDVSSIDWIQAEGDYARVHAGGKSYLVARGISDLQRRLDSEHFMRIHRSAIVNVDRIREVKSEGSSRQSVLLSDGTRLVVSRSRADGLRRWRV